MTPTLRTYCVTITGEVGPAMRAAFSDVEVAVDEGITILTAEQVDQAALFAILDRIQALGLDLIAVQAVASEGDRR